MIQAGTVVRVTDNSGARVAKVFKVLGGSRRRYASLGDIVVASVKVAEPRKQLKKKDIVKCVIVRQKKECRRLDGSYIRFDDNAVVVVDAKKDPIAARVFGPIAREVQERGFQQIVSRAKEVL